MEHILVRLESDSQPVSRRLVSLIFNSFLPVNQPEEVWCERCVTLVQMNHGAARKFYQHAHRHTACTNIGTEHSRSGAYEFSLKQSVTWAQGLSF